MNRWIGLAAVPAVALAGAAFAFGSLAAPAPSPVALSDEAAIKATVERAVEVRGLAARDFSKMALFHEVFIDDDSSPLNAQQRAAIARLAPGMVPGGFLTYNNVIFTNWREADRAFARVQAARRAGQLPDKADVLRAGPRRSDPLVMPPFDYRVISITGDRAYVEVDTPAELYRVTLVRVSGRWYVAGENNQPHP